MTICLTYDGSVNGDWIAHYAVALAAADAASGRRLRVLHVETTDISGPPLAAKFDNIRRLCARAGIEAEIEILPMRDGVFGGLRAALPGDPETLVVCGLRAKGGRRGFLHGTVSERLLNAGQGTVVALRVVQPGLLGVVRRLLLPVAGKLPGRDQTVHQQAAPMLRLSPPIPTPLAGPPGGRSRGSLRRGSPEGPLLLATPGC